MQKRNLKVVQTKDGSSTLYWEDLNESYHSLHGAVQESLHIFIQAGLLHLAKKQTHIKILEVGFGTGLNAALTLEAAQKHKLNVHYTSLEPYPLPPEIVELLNYQQFLETDFKAFHHTQWEENQVFNPNFTLQKCQITLEDMPLCTQEYDLVYYDAFAPSKQAEIWKLENMQKCEKMLVKEGLLVSYCASGQFKRNLIAAGFSLESLAGPVGKKEITRASKR